MQVELGLVRTLERDMDQEQALLLLLLLVQDQLPNHLHHLLHWPSGMSIKSLTPPVTAVLPSPMPMSYRYQRWRNVGNKWNVGLALTRLLANALYLTFAPVVLLRESIQ